MKKQSHISMRSHTTENSREKVVVEAFKIIDEWLPTNYVSLVQERVSAPSGTIRNIKSSRKGNINIINAMVEIALINKESYDALVSKVI